MLAPPDTTVSPVRPVRVPVIVELPVTEAPPEVTVRPVATARVPVKLASALMVCPLIAPEVMVPEPSPKEVPVIAPAMKDPSVLRVATSDLYRVVSPPKSIPPAAVVAWARVSTAVPAAAASPTLANCGEELVAIPWIVSIWLEVIFRLVEL